MSHSEQLAAAYTRLIEAGQKVTVRALKAEAQVSTDSAAGWLRDLEPAPGMPSVPDLSAALAVVWASAWQAAQREATTQLETRLTQTRDGEAAALLRAEQAESQAAAAVADLQVATDARHAAEAESVELVERISLFQTELSATREQVRAAETRAVRAEAEADSVRTVLADLRADLRGAIKPPPTRPAKTSAAKPAKAVGS